MLCDPEVLILDEPTAGLDPSGQIHIQEILYSLSKEKNITIFLSSHNLFEVKKYAIE
jgi:ABC-2 type transport system ATP-binding protein